LKHSITQRPVSFFITAPLPCPYLDGKVERRIVTELNGVDAASMHDTLSRVGFRRSHSLVYTPVCHGCSACHAVRTVVDEFQPSTSQRRVLKANDDMLTEEKEPAATAEQFELFSRYQESRHTGGDMATMDFYDYQALVEETPVDSSLIEFRAPDGKLVAGCLVDLMADGISAVYSYFDPKLRQRSLGTYMILWLIERAQELGLPYVYLGYWIGGSQKMAYKDKFRPLEYYGGDGWRLFSDSMVKNGIDDTAELGGISDTV